MTRPQRWRLKAGQGLLPERAVLVGKKSQSTFEQALLLEVEDVHLEATNSATHSKHCTGKDLGGLGLQGFAGDQAKGLTAGTNVPSLDLGLTQSATHIKPPGAQVECHPEVTDRLLVSQACDCHISGDERELCRVHPGVLSRRQRPVPCELGRASGLQVLGHLAVQRSTTVRRYSQV